MSKSGNAKAMSTVFQADEVFHETSTQSDVYERVGKPIEEDVVAGFSCVIFAYGQTGTGKTHTMEGDLKNRSEMAGLIPRMCNSIFERLLTSAANFTLRVTAVELYNERFRDLIGTSFRNLGEEDSVSSSSSSKTEAEVEKPIRVAEGQVTGCESVRLFSLTTSLRVAHTHTQRFSCNRRMKSYTFCNTPRLKEKCLRQK